MSSCRLLSFLLLAIYATAGSSQLSAAEADSGTNVIVILADDLGWGDLSCYGHRQFKTPQLDQMAAEGARLTNFYAACPYCAPTRAALMTGRYPHHCGMTNNPVPAEDYGVGGNRSGDLIGLPPEEITLGEAFQAAGYRTAAIGKWHLGHQPQFLPTRAGFDEYLGILYSNDMHPVALYENEERIEFPVDQRTLTRRYTARAQEFIRQNRDQPFFLYLPHAMPHKPLAASEAFAGQSGAGLYGDVVAELDWSVGELRKTLRELKLDRRTLLIFTSDNGPWFGGSTGGLRGMKGQWWEGGIRVPLLAVWPDHIPAGHVSHEPAIMMDLFPTCLGAAQAPLPQGRQLDGRDILPLWTSAAASPHRALLSVQGTPRSIRMGPWKLHVTGTPPAGGPESWGEDWVDPRRPNGTTILAPENQPRPAEFPGLRTGDRATGPALFHLGDDPGEQRNVAAEHPDVVKKLLDEFAALTAPEASRSAPP